MTTIMLVDNGSRRADATLALRRIGESLAQRLHQPVHPVSLLHSSKIPAEALNGRAADVLEPFLRHQANHGARDFLAVPLFFGPSRALTSLIPDTAARVSAEGPQVQVRVAEALCPLPHGEPRLAAIIDRAIRRALTATETPNAGATPVALLVDHGSPIPEVTAVRHWVAGQLERLSTGGYKVLEASMERRPGPEYAFNGALLAERLEQIGEAGQPTQIVVAMQFIAPGRHAGRGGDVDSICQQAQQRFPGLSLSISSLVGEDDAVVDILADRARAALARVQGAD